MQKLNGKVALITGASSGIGAATAKKLAVCAANQPDLTAGHKTVNQAGTAY